MKTFADLVTETEERLNRTHRDHPCIGTCPHCGSLVSVLSIPMFPDRPHTLEASRWYYVTCDGEAHNSMSLEAARKLPCWDDETISKTYDNLDAALDAAMHGDTKE